MTTATLTRKRRPIPRVFGLDSNGTLMTPEEFDRADFDPLWRYELINGVLIVSPIASIREVDSNEELGRLLRNYQEAHSQGEALDCTAPERLVKTGANRRRADRVIWAGLGRLPRKNDTPTIIVEFVSARKRDRERDYETKREEYRKISVQEYWIVDRFEKNMTVHILEDGEYRKKIVLAKQTYRTPLLPGFVLRLERLFELSDRWPDDEE